MGAGENRSAIEWAMATPATILRAIAQAERSVESAARPKDREEELALLAQLALDTYSKRTTKWQP